MKQFINGDPPTIIRSSQTALLAGMAGGFFAVSFDFPGLITSIFLLTLGAAGASLAAYRAERGLWMLAAVLLVMFTAIYILISAGEIRDVLRNAPNPPISLTIDFAIATALLTTNLRFLWRVALFNWSLSKSV